MSKKNLMSLLSGLKGLVSVSGDVDTILVLSEVHTLEDAQNIVISGLDEELGNVNFNICKDAIASITTLCSDIEVLYDNGKLIIVSGC